MFRNLKAEMTRNNISTKQVSELLGVSEKTTRNYINGNSKIAWLDILRIQKEFFPDLNFVYLFDIEEKEKTNH